MGKRYTSHFVGKELRHIKEVKSAHYFSEPNSICLGHDYSWYLALYTTLCIQHTALVELSGCWWSFALQYIKFVGPQVRDAEGEQHTNSDPQETFR